MTENGVPHYKQWTNCYTLLGDDYSLLSFDLGLHRLLPREDQNNVLQVLVRIKSPDENGLPEKEEAELLDKMGQAIFAEFDRLFEISYVGFLASDKVCGFYFCVDTVFDQDNHVDRAMESFPDYEYQVNILEDDQWKVYTECFFPGFQRSELIQHSMVVTRLEEDHDPLAVPRKVEHWCYFRKPEDRAAFMEKIREENFHIEDTSEDLEQEHWPYGVRFSRPDKVDRETVFQFTMYLWDLAYQFYGNYDGWETFIIKQ